MTIDNSYQLTFVEKVFKNYDSQEKFFNRIQWLSNYFHVFEVNPGRVKVMKFNNELFTAEEFMMVLMCDPEFE